MMSYCHEYNNMTVIYPSVTDRPEQITVFNTAITGITEILLSWTIPNDNFAPIHSHNLSFKIAGVDEFTVQNISGTENTNRLTVKFNQVYTIQISSCNVVGCGDPARVVVFSARPGTPCSHIIVHTCWRCEYIVHTCTCISYMYNTSSNAICMPHEGRVHVFHHHVHVWRGVVSICQASEFAKKLKRWFVFITKESWWEDNIYLYAYGMS